MLIIGNYIRNLECKSFLDIETNRVRIRPSNNQGIPADLVIECSREYSDTTKFPLGTKFIAEDVVVYNKQLAELIR